MIRSHTKGQLKATVESRARGAEQRALPLKHRRWRPTAEYAHRLERELMLARMEIEKLNERLAWWAAEYRKIQRLAA